MANEAAVVKKLQVEIENQPNQLAVCRSNGNDQSGQRGYRLKIMIRETSEAEAATDLGWATSSY